MRITVAVDEVLRLWGRNITMRRKALDMSQETLAGLLDPPVTQPTIARWERGLMEPRRHYKAQLAGILQADHAMLFPATAATVGR